MKKRSIFFSLLLPFVLLSSCTNPNASNSNPTAKAMETQVAAEASSGLVMKSYEGKTAIVTKDTEISDPYFISENDEMEPVVEKISYQVPLSSNDIILVIAEEDGFCRIIIPYGDMPQVRGKIAKELISYDTSLFQKANQTYLNNAAAYVAINGKETDYKTGAGVVEERKNGWALVTFPGGDSSFWVKANELTYEFDMQIEDVDPYSEPSS